MAIFIGMSESQRLEQIIQLVMEQTMTVQLCNGNVAPIGSPEHIADMQDTLERMKVTRNSYPRASSARADYARACNRLTRTIRKSQARLARQAPQPTPELDSQSQMI